MTTRAPRSTELDGREYFFVSKEGFQKVNHKKFSTLRREALWSTARCMEIIMALIGTFFARPRNEERLFHYFS